MKDITVLRVIIGVLLVALACIAYHPARKCICEDKKSYIAKLVRQAARWSTASRQDANALIRVLHANYGMGYLQALGEIATPSEVEIAININYREFADDIVAVQDLATRAAVDECPSFGPARTVLTNLGGE